ncbi:hypothetical protein STANM309S_00041 [Streptomyces tanashiensis]
MGARVRYVLSVTLEPKARIGTNVLARQCEGPSHPTHGEPATEPSRSFTPAGHVLSIPT